MGKRSDARAAAREGVESAGGWGDAVVLQELARIGAEAAEVGAAQQSAPSATAPVAAAPLADKANGESEALQRNLDEVAQSRMLQYGVGNAEVDKQIALGYWHTNSGHYREAIALFSGLLKQHPRIVAAFLGRGTAFAMSGRLRDAVSDFTQAVALDPACVEGLKRRGQSLLAMNEFRLAMQDFDTCLRLAPADADACQQRGVCFYKMRDFLQAKDAFEEATRRDATARDAWNQLGLTFNQLGRSRDAVAAHETAAALEPGHAETWSHLGQSHKELGNFDRADEAFSQSLALQPGSASAHWLRGLARYLAGQHTLAMRDLRGALRLAPEMSEPRALLAVVLAARGRFAECVAESDTLLRASPDHYVWYTRRLALVTQHSLRRPWTEFSLDATVEDVVKEGHCKRRPARLACPAQHAKDLALLPGKEVEQSPLESPGREVLVQAALAFGPRFQYNTPGFVVNKRQWLSAGLSIIQMAQAMRADGSLTWRQVFDVAVGWRQLSEPNDPVWWVDRLPFVQFCEGYGSHTPIVTGQCQTVRYGAQLERALHLVKSLICSRPEVSSVRRREVEESTTLAQLFAAMRRDFWVTTACHSSERPGKILEGTRLTLQCVAGGGAGEGVTAAAGGGIGYEFSIRTPGTPHRFAEFAIELDLVWRRLRGSMARLREGRCERDELLDAALRVVFFWYNLMPLSRGTSAIGGCMLHAALLACDLEIAVPIPDGLQPDWDAILSSTADEFCLRMKHWIVLRDASSSTLAGVGAVVSTVENAIIILNTMGK
jgi:tetratricopeptide (TPR) repeat protein